MAFDGRIVTGLQLRDIIARHLAECVWLMPMHPASTHLVQMAIDLGAICSTADSISSFKQ